MCELGWERGPALSRALIRSMRLSRKEIVKLKNIVAVALLGTLALSGCAVGIPGLGDKPETGKQGESQGQQTDRVEIGAVPEWSPNPVDVGELIGTAYTEFYQVDVFQVGTAETLDDSSWEDSETGENLLPAGSEIAILNFVYTNTSGETQIAGINMGNPSFTTDSWRYYGGMPGESRDEHFEPHGMSWNFVRPDAIEDFEHIAMEIAPGESVAEAATVQYVTDEELIVSIRIPKVAADGETDFADVQEFQQEFRIKLK